MTFTKEQVLASCQKIAPQYGFTPSLIYAICQQEGAREGTDWDPSVARLEQGFYRRYVEQMNYATTSEVLLSASYGVMQMMGESLMELGYFEWYFDQQPQEMKGILDRPRSQFAIPSAIDYYCTHLDVMIEWGVKWFKRKFNAAGGDTTKALLAWNGGADPQYAAKVLARMTGT